MLLLAGLHVRRRVGPRYAWTGGGVVAFLWGTVSSTHGLTVLNDRQARAWSPRKRCLDPLGGLVPGVKGKRCIKI